MSSTRRIANGCRSLDRLLVWAPDLFNICFKDVFSASDSCFVASFKDEMVTHRELESVPLLVVCNKQDVEVRHSNLCSNRSTPSLKSQHPVVLSHSRNARSA